MRTTRSVMVRFFLSLAEALVLDVVNAGFIAPATASDQIYDGGSYFIAGGHFNFTTNRLIVGGSNANTSLTIMNGGSVRNDYGVIGYGSLFFVCTNSQVTVNGPSSVWTNSGGLDIGYLGYRSILLITNGGTVTNDYNANIGVGWSYGLVFSDGNKAVVGGANSQWNINGDLIVGAYGKSNILQIVSGGTVNNSNAVIGQGPAGGNKVSVSGPNSVWNNRGYLSIGEFYTNGNGLLITNSGTVSAARGVTVYTNSQLAVEGGSLLTTGLDVRSVTVLNSGLIQANTLITTSTNSLFLFNGGTLRVQSLSNNKSQTTFYVGNGTNVATLDLGGGTISVTNSGITVSANATLTGTGTINGSVTNSGTIFLTNADQLIFTGPVVNKGVIIVVTGTPRFGSTFTNLGTLITTASINVANVSVSGPDIVLQFNSVSTYLHEVQVSTNVSSGLWQSLTNGLLGTGSPITFTDPGGALSPNRTYRVLLH